MRLACSLVSFAHFSPGRSYLCYITNAYWIQMSQKKQRKQTLYWKKAAGDSSFITIYLSGAKLKMFIFIYIKRCLPNVILWNIKELPSWLKHCFSSRYIRLFKFILMSPIIWYVSVWEIMHHLQNQKFK